jgi:hypothetical protein
MEAQLRNAARRHLPNTVRKPLGWLAGKFRESVVRPVLDLIFDLRITEVWQRS